MKKILVCMLVCLFCAGVQAQKTAKIKATAVEQPAVPVQGQPTDGVRGGTERAGPDEGKRLALDDCMSRRRD